MLPPLGNQWIISIKDTSLFIVIGVAELTRQGQEIIAGNFRALNLERRGGVLSDYYPGAELYSASSWKKDENPVIEFKNVSKHFGPTQALHNIDLNIAQGEVVVIIGLSGSGKSTLLRCINKLEEITSGDLIVDGLKVNDPKLTSA